MELAKGYIEFVKRIILTNLIALIILLGLVVPARSAAKKILPPLKLVGTYQSTSVSPNKEASSAIYNQVITFGPLDRRIEFFGNTAQTTLTFEQRYDIYEIARAPGFNRTGITAFVGFQDSFNRLQLKGRIDEKATTGRFAADPTKTAFEYTSDRKLTAVQLLPPATILLADITSSASNTGAIGASQASETLSAFYSLDTTLSGMHLTLNRTTKETKRTIPFRAETSGSSSDYSYILWEFLRKNSLGEISSKYEFSENVTSVFPDSAKPSIARTERLNIKLAKELNSALKLSGTIIQEKDSPPEAEQKQKYSQRLDLDWNLPIKGQSGQNSVGLTLLTVQDTGGGRDIGTYTLDYQVKLFPKDNISLTFDGRKTDTTDLKRDLPEKSSSSSSGTISFKPSNYFNVIGKITQVDEREFPPLRAGGSVTQETFQLSMIMKTKKGLTFSMGVSDSSRDNLTARRPIGKLEQDVFSTNATLSLPIRSNSALTASYVNESGRIRPGTRTVQSNLVLTFNMQLAENLTWSFQLNGIDKLDRDRPINNTESSTLTSTFTVTF